MKKKVVLVIICLIVVFLVGLLFIIHKKSNTIILKKEEFIYELGEEISADVSNYIKDADSIKNITEYKIVTDDFRIVDKKLVINNDKPTVGNYSINIVYKNVSKKVVIKIVDTTSPEFTTFEENIKIEQTSEELDLLKYFEATDLTEVKITIDGEYDLTQEGDYDINVIAIDANGNKTSKKATITVYKKEIEKETPVIKQDNNISDNKSSNNTTTTKPETPSARYRKDVSDSYIVKINAYRKANGMNELPVQLKHKQKLIKEQKNYLLIILMMVLGMVLAR